MGDHMGRPAGWAGPVCRRAWLPARARRQRRPTGEPPPPPRPVAITATAWLVLAAGLAVAFVVAQHTSGLRADERAGTWVLRQLAVIRTPWLTDVANGISWAGSGWGARVLGLSVVALTIAFRRWRHLAVFVGGLLFLDFVGMWFYPPAGAATTVRRADHRRLERACEHDAAGGVPRVLPAGGGLLPGRARPGPLSYQGGRGFAVVAVFVLARLYLGVDHPEDKLLGAALAVAVAVTVFGYFAPDEVFPVAYRRGRTAHVDVTGRRAKAIRAAVADQLGLDVTEIKPVGLKSSAGSTPLRLRVGGGPEQFVFAKLYTKGHVRADRWYKLGRTILYGTLEDEAPFQTVERLAEYEDYALRLVQEAGVRTARPHGIVEITPKREYLLVTEFFKDAVEIGDAEVDDAVIDQGLVMIRKLRDAGIAHRDIKPGNLMVRSGELLLIDVCFVQVRPSPWRQAVDLGNMMLVLALRTDPQRVYQRALAYFTPDELAEAFAATRGGGQPHPAPRLPETRPARPARRIPRPGAATAADRAATLERPADLPGRLPGRRDARHHRRRRGFHRSGLPRGLPGPVARPSQLRHRPHDDPQRPGSPVGGQAALHRHAPLGLELRRR